MRLEVDMVSDRHPVLSAWLIIFLGILLLSFGFVSYYVFNIGLIWIGGLILGITIVIAALNMLKETSIVHHQKKKTYEETDSDYITLIVETVRINIMNKRAKV